MFDHEDSIVVSMTHPFILDFALFECWLKGQSEKEVAEQMHTNGVLEEYGISINAAVLDVRNQFLHYHLAESLLCQPQETFTVNQTNHCLLPMTDQQTLRVIIMYYRFDECVMRALLGKKLNSRDRRDCEEISEKLGVPQRSIWRQFDNVRRVFKRVEDMQGDLVSNIANCFLMPDWLAQQYAAVVILTNYRFETSKKKLQYVTFHDFAFCASQMIQHWSNGKLLDSAPVEGSFASSVDFDPILFQELKDLKNQLEKKEYMDDHRNKFVLSLHECSFSMPSVGKDAEVNFKNFSKNSLTIAANLGNSREIREFFIRIIEKFIEPLRNLHWKRSDCETVLHAFSRSLCNSLYFQRHPDKMALAQRFFQPFNCCVLQLFP